MQPLINPEEPKKPLSDAKLAANRENAQRSNGPKTDLGKQESSKNARKHCLLAMGVIPEVDGQDADQERARLEAELWDQYQPVGFVEELQFEKMVTAYWLDRRALRSLDAQTGVSVVRKKRALAAEKLTSNGEMEERATVTPEVLLLTAAGVAKVISALQRVHEILATKAKLTEPARELLVRHLGADRLRVLLAGQPATPPAGTPNQDGWTIRLVAQVGLELASLKQRKAELEAEESKYEGLQVVAAGLEDVHLEKALRYGTKFERKAERARKELERSQALRRRGPRAA